MFANIGKKIKGVAIFAFALGVVLSILVAICIFVSIEELSYWYGESIIVAGGLFVIIVGSILSWMNSYLLYGFGELVDKVCEIADNTQKGKEIESKPDDGSQKKELLEKWLKEGLISEEEYLAKKESL